MLAKMFPRTVEASFHRGDTGFESLGNFGMTAPLLDQRQERTILRPQLGQSMAKRVEFLGIHRAGRFGNVFMLFPKRQKNPPQLLPAQLVNTRIPGQSKQPRLKLRRSLQTIQSPDHLDKDLLGQVLHVIASSRHGVHETSHPVLVADNEFMLGGFFPLLSPADEISQRTR
jgi:hypothetical protein